MYSLLIKDLSLRSSLFTSQEVWYFITVTVFLANSQRKTCTVPEPQITLRAFPYNYRIYICVFKCVAILVWLYILPRNLKLEPSFC